MLHSPIELVLDGKESKELNDKSDESAEQGQIARMCGLVLLYSLRKRIMVRNERIRVTSSPHNKDLSECKPIAQKTTYVLEMVDKRGKSNFFPKILFLIFGILQFKLGPVSNRFKSSKCFLTNDVFSTGMMKTNQN